MKLLVIIQFVIISALAVFIWRKKYFQKRPKVTLEEQCDIKAILDIFHLELTLACQAFFAWKTIHNLAASDKNIYNSINRNALSWNLILHSLQVTFFITIGRIFDTDPNSFSVHKVFRCCKKEIQEFNKDNLRLRKLGDSKEIPDWLDKYIEDAYEAQPADFKKIKKKVNKVQKVYEDIYRPIRHKIFAHKDSEHLSKTSGLFQKTSIGQVEKILTTLHQAEMSVQQLYDNGRLGATESWKLDEEDYVQKDIESLLNKIAKI